MEQAHLQTETKSLTATLLQLPQLPIQSLAGSSKKNRHARKLERTSGSRNRIEELESDNEQLMLNFLICDASSDDVCKVTGTF